MKIFVGIERTAKISREEALQQYVFRGIPPDVEKTLRQEVIERLDRGWEKGWRFSNWHYAYRDVVWQKISDHYLIMKRERPREHRLYLMRTRTRNITPKPTFGPYPVEILEPDMPEDKVERRCMDKLLFWAKPSEALKFSSIPNTTYLS